MKEAKKAELIIKHAAARRRLRAEGAEESLGNVLKLAGGSKRDIVALWTQSDPDTAPLPMTDAEANFRTTFATYLEAAIRFNAISLGPFDLPQRHPWYEKLKEELATAYNNHIAAWHVIEGYEEAQRPAPEPPPPPPAPPALPAADLTNLRAYYRAGGPAPWGTGAKWPEAGVPPLEMYELLTQLYKEVDDLVVRAGRVWMEAKNEAGTLRGTHDEAPVHQAEERMSAARLIQYRIKGDMDQMQQNARYQGVALPT